MWWKFVRLFGKVEAIFENAALGRLSSEMLAKGKTALPGHTLFHFQASPFALRVRRELIRHGVAIPMKDILEDAAAQSELVSQGKRDQVPCLRIEVTGAPTRWLYESGDIVEYLRNKFSNG